MKGERDNLDVVVPIDGFEREYFNEDEKAHMVDVRNLCLLVKSIRNYSFYAVIGCIIIAFILIVIFSKGNKNNLKNNFNKCIFYFSKNYFIISISFLGIVIALGIFAAVDFRDFWHLFHKVLFKNGLWILDSSKDLLMRMMTPSMFFLDIVLKIVICFVIIFLFTVICSLFAKKKLKNKILY